MTHIPESPPECKALLAEALETLAKFPPPDGTFYIEDVESWWHERGHPTTKLIEVFLAPDSVTPST